MREAMVMALPQYCDYHVDRRTLGIQHARRAGTPFIILRREQRHRFIERRVGRVQCRATARAHRTGGYIFVAFEVLLAL